eukprot:CAMPEP_0172743538 /NCGR_PEP_ID=MMETSP1074-20121228/132515_1 /TAXON_ID=2916 /ORGANISM="Ceratium fusus, Strain PA161109" /LENGTH=58 /DNA_ID=CAMNT_0013574281 /DNA_START=255 /DNA_END=431 /DNA_ORIENTATION=+
MTLSKFSLISASFVMDNCRHAEAAVITAQSKQPKNVQAGGAPTTSAQRATPKTAFAMM